MRIHLPAGLLLACALAPVRAQEFAVPVLLESPPCDFERLGPVRAEVGSRVNESTDDSRVPTVRIEKALAKLAQAAFEAGGNAVVLRSRQGVFFTHHGRRSSAPVFIKLGGGALRLPDDTTPCRLVHVDPRAMQAEMRGDKARQVWAQDAYAED